MKARTVEISCHTGEAEIRCRGLGVFEKQPLGNSACKAGSMRGKGVARKPKQGVGEVRERERSS